MESNRKFRELFESSNFAQAGVGEFITSTSCSPASSITSDLPESTEDEDEDESDEETSEETESEEKPPKGVPENKVSKKKT